MKGFNFNVINIQLLNKIPKNLTTGFLRTYCNTGFNE